MKNITFKNSTNNLRFRNVGIILFLFIIFSNSIEAQPKKWVAPAAADQLKNPTTADANSLKESKKLYVTNCGPCHGNSGKGDGIAAASINPKPADHTSVAIQKETDGSLYWKLTEGRSPMPSYKQILTDVQRWQLINYIRSIAKK